MQRAIVSFHEDASSDWVAELSCGHRRHVRHQPPLSERPWVVTAEGRQSRIGLPLDCNPCDRRMIPPGYEPYRRTPTFSRESVPKALLERHTTKAGVWARIHVVEGSLDYVLHDPFDSRELLTPHAPGIVLPEVEHHLEMSGPVSFYVEFWRPGAVSP
jgi:tellurite methyltransferase